MKRSRSFVAAKSGRKKDPLQSGRTRWGGGWARGAGDGNGVAERRMDRGRGIRILGRVEVRMTARFASAGDWIAECGSIVAG
jgi:hypothetical protein